MRVHQWGMYEAMIPSGIAMVLPWYCHGYVGKVSQTGLVESLREDWLLSTKKGKGHATRSGDAASVGTQH